MRTKIGPTLAVRRATAAINTVYLGFVTHQRNLMDAATGFDISMDTATIVGFIAVITCLFVGIGQHLPAMLDVRSAIIVVGGTIALLLVSFRLEDVVNLFRFFLYAFIPPKEGTAGLVGDLKLGARMFRRARTYAQASGWCGVFIGVVIMLKNIDDPAAIGPGAAIAILTAFYGVVIGYLVCLPIQTKLERHLEKLQES